MLKLNLDETAVRFYYKPRSGLRIKRTGLAASLSPCDLVHHASKAQQRKAMTHVAVVCDDTTIQPKLPQVLLANESTILARDLPGIRSTLSGNVHVWRMKSAWINAAVMIDIFALLGAALAPFMNLYQPIFLMDAHKAHFAAKVLRAAAKHKIWVIIVPAQMTFLLQPLDTDGFYKYKQFLRKRYTELMSSTTTIGDLTAAAVILAVIDACKHILNAVEWGPIFCRNGFGDEQRSTRTSILQSLEWKVVPHINSTMPSLEQFKTCFPGGVDIAFSALFADMMRNPFPPERSVVEDAAEVVEPELLPWSQRLRPRRSSESLHIAQADAQNDSLVAPTSEAGAASSSWLPAAPPAPRMPTDQVPRAVRLRLPPAAPQRH